MNYHQYSIPKKYILKITLIIGAMVLISGAAYGSWKIFSKSERATIETESPLESSVSNTTSSEPDLMADWKVYRNEKYGYEVKYPKDWYSDVFLNASKSYSIIFFQPKTSVKNYVSIFTDFDIDGLTKDLSLQNAVKILIGENNFIKRDLDLNGNRAIEVREPGIEESTNIYFQRSDGLLFRITLYPADSAYRNVLERMLYTFRFVK